MLYDALYSWAAHLQRAQDRHAPPPAWTTQLRQLIQDHLDTNLSLRLPEAADTLQVNPRYLSRKFARYFDNLSFGEYIRKLRIDKARLLLDTTAHPLAEIAYPTGFSDQSHFTRIIRQHTGQSPSAYRKNRPRT